MAALDRFGGPEAWDLYCDRQEREYKALIAGKTCLDCGECVKCEIEGHENIGYCREDGEFVTDDETIEEMGIECFRAAA